MSIETPRSISVGGQSTISNARQLADALATNLDKEKEEMFRNLQKRREQAEQKLQEVRAESILFFYLCLFILYRISFYYRFRPRKN